MQSGTGDQGSGDLAPGAGNQTLHRPPGNAHALPGRFLTEAIEVAETDRLQLVALQIDALELGVVTGCTL